VKAFTIVKCLVVNERNEVLLLRRSGTAPRRAGEWDFPGGFVDAGEDLTAAVIRETREEAGIEIESPRLVYSMSELADKEEYGSGNWLAFVVNVTGQPKVTLSYEHDKYIWAEQTKLLDYIAYDRQQKMLRYVTENGLTEEA